MEWNLADPFKARSDNHNNQHADIDKLSQAGSHRAVSTINDAVSSYPDQYDLEEKKRQQDQKKQYHIMLDKQRLEKQNKDRMERQHADQQIEDDGLEEMQKAKDKKYQEYMNGAYKSALEYKREKEREKRDAEVEEERERLKRIQKELKEEEAKRGVKKATFVHEAQEVANNKRMMKELTQKQKLDEKSEYQKLSQINYQREVERENNYKNYFREYDNDMSERVANHMKYVTSAEIEKQQKLDQFEDNRIQEHQRTIQEREEQDMKDRLKRTLDANSTNKNMIAQIDQKRLSKREKYQKLVEQRQKEEQQVRDQEKQLFDEEELKRKLYREALDYQKNIHDYDKTTKSLIERNLAQKNGFGSQKVEPQGMVPGIHNIQSIGSKAVLRKAQDDMPDLNTFSNLPNQSLANSYKGLGGSKSMMDIHVKDAPVKRPNKYDPITNPIPSFNQNPYVNREKALVVGESPSNMLHSNRGPRRSLLSSTAEKNILI